jgi:hypothetical protein
MLNTTGKLYRTLQVNYAEHYLVNYAEHYVVNYAEHYVVNDRSKIASHNMAYLYEACDQKSDFFHQQLLRKM